MNHDLTNGEPSVVLRRFCIPLFGSIIFQQLYNLADSWVAGRFIGENALAAVGNSYEITLVYLAFAFGLSISCSVMVSQFFGARRHDELKTTIYTTYLSCTVLSLVFIVTGLCGSERLLQCIHTPMEIMADSRCYLDIYTLGVPLVLFYNVATGGIAWATFLCQGFSCVAALLVIHHRLKEFPGTAHCFSWKLFKALSSIAVPSILQQGAISVGNIMLQGDINTFGPGVIAGYSAAVKLNNLVITSFTTLGNGISNYTAQNLGARKDMRVSDGFKAGCKLVWLLCLPLCVLYFLGSSWLIHLFLERRPSYQEKNHRSSYGCARDGKHFLF